MKKPAEPFSFSSGMSSGEASCDVYKNKVSPTTNGEGSAVYLVWKSGMFTCSAACSPAPIRASPTSRS